MSARLSEAHLHELFLKTDLAYFAEHMLGMEISGHHCEWSDLLSKHKKLAINAARDHGKSYFFSFAYVIWRAYYGWIPPLPSASFKSIPRSSLGYIFSSSQENAVKFLALVKEELQRNPKLQHLVPIRKDIWSKSEIKLTNNAVVRARGYGVAVRGGHPGWAVCDDVLTDESIYSEVTREKDKDYFYSAVTPMVIPGGQLVVVGTPMHIQDLYGDLSENTEYHFAKFTAIGPDGSALWPTRYSTEMLKARKREIGSVRFAREYECIPVSDSSSLFPEKILKENYDHMQSLVTTMTDALFQDYEIFTGVDLALSASVGADASVITTIGIDRFKNRRIFDIRRSKGRSMTDQLKDIQDVYNTFRPRKIFIEDNQFQRVFKDELVAHTDLPVYGFTTTGHNKNSLERGVPSLQILFENKKWVIPRATERDRRITDVLINELKCFTWVNGKLQGVGAHDDCVMSLWIANEAASSSAFSFSFG